MKVFNHAERALIGLPFTVYCTPGAHLEGTECPAEWFDRKGEAIRFDVVFKDGEATVPDHLGRYLVAQGLASKNRPTIVQLGVAARAFPAAAGI